MYIWIVYLLSYLQLDAATLSIIGGNAFIGELEVMAATKEPLGLEEWIADDMI